jgi:hypothetical protein
MKFQLECALFASPDNTDESGFFPKLFTWVQRYYSDSDDILLNPLDVNGEPEKIIVHIDLPDVSEQEMAQKAIATLKDKIERKRAENEIDCARLQEKINSLLMLEYKPRIENESDK